MAKVSIRGLKRPVFDTALQAASSRLGVQPEWLESTASTYSQRFAESARALVARGKSNLEDQETIWVRFHPRHGWYALEPGEQLEDEHA
jgi:transglutaminase-like putative cysteine protease